MRIVVTGGSSPIGSELLRCLLADARVERVYCSVHRNPVPIVDPRVEFVPLDLETGAGLEQWSNCPDVVVHAAGVSRASKPGVYWSVNLDGTIKLAAWARQAGCGRFVFISSRVATEQSGDYGESKLAAEKALASFGWPTLTIIRPAEIYGGNASGGIELFIRLAKKWRVVPMLCGDSRIEVAPLHIADFVARTASIILDSGTSSSVCIVELCGPENLSGVELAMRLVRHYWAIPLPVWWPGAAVVLQILIGLGVQGIPSDQVRRITCQKTSHAPGVGNQSLRKFPAGL
jgi:nucleoside-diphosphate-sugar epimerase